MQMRHLASWYADGRQIHELSRQVSRLESSYQPPSEHSPIEGSRTSEAMERALSVNPGKLGVYTGTLSELNRIQDRHTPFTFLAAAFSDLYDNLVNLVPNDARHHPST